MITEKELLQMSTDEYMNQEQLNFFKEKLLSEEFENSKKMQFLIDQHKENILNNKSADAIDQQVIESDSRLAAAETSRVALKNKKIKIALEKIKAGEYGFCENTGDEIGIRRLLFDPTISLSVSAQEELEIRSKQYAN